MVESTPLFLLLVPVPSAGPCSFCWSLFLLLVPVSSAGPSSFCWSLFLRLVPVPSAELNMKPLFFYPSTKMEESELVSECSRTLNKKIMYHNTVNLCYHSQTPQLQDGGGGIGVCLMYAANNQDGEPSVYCKESWGKPSL